MPGAGYDPHVDANDMVIIVLEGEIETLGERVAPHGVVIYPTGEPHLLAWSRTGFGTHVSREIPADATTPGVVARYMSRPPITPERMLRDASKAQIICRSDAVHPRHQANFRVSEPLDFLAGVSAHIPDAHEKTTLFYGCYSNRTRGYRKQHGLFGDASPPDPAADEGTQAPRELRRS